MASLFHHLIPYKPRFQYSVMSATGYVLKLQVQHKGGASTIVQPQQEVDCAFVFPGSYWKLSPVTKEFQYKYKYFIMSNLMKVEFLILECVKIKKAHDCATLLL